METTTLWHLSNTSTKLQTAPLAPDKSNVLIKSLYSLVSHGTEKLVISGKVPENMHRKMQVPGMQGSFSFPCTYGYSVVGKVMEGPQYLIDEHVHVMQPHQSCFFSKEESLYVIPQDIPFKRALFASHLETVMNAIWDGAITVGDKVMIAGFGILGALLSTVLQKMPGVNVVVVDNNPERQKMAASLGFETVNSMNLTGMRCDVAINTSSNETGLQTCIDAVGYEGTVVELSWYGDKSVNINLGNDFHTMRKKIVSSQVSNIPGNRSNRWDFKRRKELVFKLLKDKMFDDLLVYTKEIDFIEAPSFYHTLRKANPDQLTTIIKY